MTVLIQARRVRPFVTQMTVENVITKLDTLQSVGFFDRVLHVDRAAFKLSRAKLGDLVARIVANNKADATEKEYLTVGDLIAAADACALPVDQKKAPLTSGFANRLLHKSLNWPFPGVVPGGTAVMGEMESGKTRFVLTTSGADIVFRISEPLENIDEEDFSVPLDSYVATVCGVIAYALCDAKVAIDSLRGLMYNLQGDATEGGVKSGLYDLLTFLNNLFAEIGATVIMTINPMSSTGTKVDGIYKRVGSSLAAILLMQDGSIAKSSYRNDQGRRVPVVDSIADSVPGAQLQEDVHDGGGNSLYLNTQRLQPGHQAVDVARQFGAVDVTAAEDAPVTRQFPRLV